MKIKNLSAISVLVYQASAQNQWFNELPAMKAGAAGDDDFSPAQATETSCPRCIRKGYVWCASEWNYELPTATTAWPASAADAGDLGQCCYQVGETLTASNAWSGSCAARFTNGQAAGSTAEKSAGTWWCSDQNLDSLELALITCRQMRYICGAAQIPQFTSVTKGDSSIAHDSPNSTQRLITKASFNKGEKCSWIVKSTQGAPTFQITSADLGSMAQAYDIHYVEYDSTVKTKGNTNNFILFSETNVSNSLLAKNIVHAKKYDKEEFYGIENPQVYSILNPDQTASLHKRRWFPVELAQQDIDRQVSINMDYEALKSSYDTALVLYYSYFEGNTAGLSSPPVVPTKPTQPDAYSGLYIYPTTLIPTSKNTQHFFVDKEMGGWGGLTMGLLEPIKCGEKSFGVYGIDADTAALCAYTSRQEKSFVWNQADMTADNQNAKYMIVSVWANKWDADTLENVLGTGNDFKILFSSSAWKTGNVDSWAAPSQPAAAADLKSVDALNLRISLSVLNMAFLANLVL